MVSVLSWVHIVGAAIYGVSLTTFTVALILTGTMGRGDLRAWMRRFQAWGPGLGLSMGALIFGGLATYWLQTGGFQWPVDTAEQQRVAAKHLVFLVLWASAFHLEIWTLDPVRKIASGQIAGDYAAAAKRVTLQASVNTALFWVVAALA